MRKAAFVLLAGLFAAAWPSASAQAQYAGGLVPSLGVRSHGLVRRWQAHVEVDRARGRVDLVHQHVSSTQLQVIYEVHFGDQVRDFSERTLDAFGVPWGKEGAKREAEELADTLIKSGTEARVVERVVPEITLYVTTDQSIVHAIDAETGRTRWAQAVGRRDFPTLTPGANDNFVAIVNGSTLYVLNAVDGRLVWERPLTGAAGAAPAVSQERVIVPMVNGAVESHPLVYDRRPPYIFKSHGQTMIQPVVSPLSVAWPTDRGYLYVGNANAVGVRYRLEALANIVAQPAIAPAPDRPGRVFICSLDGYLYCLDELSGAEIWRFSTGEPLSRSPIVLGDQVFVITDDFGMHSISTDAKELWWTFGVRQFIAASADRVYCLGQGSQILVLDRKSGRRIREVAVGPMDLIVSNILTDRIFVGNRFGAIQCLHEPLLDKPLVHVAIEPEAPAAGRPQIEQGPVPERPAAPPMVDPADPFGAPAADPFGAPPAAGDANPFGGAPAGAPPANPFGGAAPSAPAADPNDPFGNPFQ